MAELIQIWKQFDLKLSWLLQGSWIAAILPILVAFIPSSRLDSFRQFCLGTARRGKILPSPSSQRFTVPQKFFLHFYIVSVVWTTTLLALTWQYAYKVAPLKFEAGDVTGAADTFAFGRFGYLSMMERLSVWRSVFLLLLMEIQVLRRLYETLFVFKYSRPALPLSLWHGCAFEVLNFAVHQMREFPLMNKESIQGIDLHIWGYLEPFTKLEWYTWAGAAIFIWGWIHQRNCHAILGSLRRDKRDQDKHVIPRGDWFNYVSNPHYFAEMVIYAGFVIASGGFDLTIWLAFAFTVMNLSFAAGDIHEWYLQKFEDYPQNRKAVIPFIY